MAKNALKNSTVSWVRAQTMWNQDIIFFKLSSIGNQKKIIKKESKSLVTLPLKTIWFFPIRKRPRGYGRFSRFRALFKKILQSAGGFLVTWHFSRRFHEASEREFHILFVFVRESCVDFYVASKEVFWNFPRWKWIPKLLRDLI